MTLHDFERSLYNKVIVTGHKTKPKEIHSKPQILHNKPQILQE